MLSLCHLRVNFFLQCTTKQGDVNIVSLSFKTVLGSIIDTHLFPNLRLFLALMYVITSYMQPLELLKFLSFHYASLWNYIFTCKYLLYFSRIRKKEVSDYMNHVSTISVSLKALNSADLINGSWKHTHNVFFKNNSDVCLHYPASPITFPFSNLPSAAPPCPSQNKHNLHSEQDPLRVEWSYFGWVIENTVQSLSSLARSAFLNKAKVSKAWQVWRWTEWGEGRVSARLR